MTLEPSEKCIVCHELWFEQDGYVVVHERHVPKLNSICWACWEIMVNDIAEAIRRRSAKEALWGRGAI